MSQLNAPFVVLACGNPGRGDDALGPLLLARLAEWLAEEGLAGYFELIEDFQFQIEHALDLQGRQAALFIDAGDKTVAPFSLLPVQADAGFAHTSHALSPGAVLAVLARIDDARPPRAHTLCVRGERFELGEGLSAAASGHLEPAWAALQDWCRACIAGDAGVGAGSPAKPAS